jgi:hypothetical protein
MPENLKALEGLREGLKRFLQGDYPNPREHRPGTCSHGVNYWETCEQCNDDFLKTLLDTYQPRRPKPVAVEWAEPPSPDPSANPD